MNTRRQSVTGWLLLLPAAVLLAAFTHYPALATFWHSFFTTPRANRSARFVGLENYELLMEDPVFWTALTNNAWYALGTILPSMALAIVMALWVNRQMVGRGWVRLAYFTPTVLPMIAVANIWLFFYTPDYGLLDQVRSLWGGAPHNWLGSQETALGAVVAFLTPIGHHGNLLILGPGQYRFGDFLRVGLPLTVIVALVSAWMARWLWLGGPLLPHFGG